MKLHLKTYLFFFLLLFFTISSAYSQSNKDTLIKAFKEAIYNKTQKDKIINQGEILFDIDINKAWQYGQQCLAVSMQIKSKYGVAKSLSYLGRFYSMKGDYTKALEYFNNAENIFKQINDNDGVLSSWNNIGLNYLNQQDYQQALTYFQKLLKAVEKKNDESKLYRCYNNIGIVHASMHNASLGEEYFKKALSVAEQAKDSVNIIHSLNNLSMFYSDIGDSISEEKYLYKAYKFSEVFHNNEERSQCLNNIGLFNDKHKKYSVAVDYYQKALSILEDRNDLRNKAWDLTYIATAYYHSNNIEQALKYALMGIDISKDLSVKDLYSNTLKILSDCYAKKGNYEKAFEFHKKYKDIEDNIYNINSNKHILEMEAKYQNEKKENELKLLRKENELKQSEQVKERRLWLLISISILLIFSIALTISLTIYFKQKLKLNNAEIKSKELLISKDKLEILLEAKRKEMENLALFIIEKNNFFEKIKEMLENKQDANSIIQYLNQNYTLTKERKEFNLYLNNINKDFLTNLSVKFPQLNESDKRLATLLKLNFSTKEIASILNLTIKGVEVKRYRLRKKIGAPEVIDLSEYFAGI